MTATTIEAPADQFYDVYGLTAIETRIAEMRKRISDVLLHPDTGLIVAAGPGVEVESTGVSLDESDSIANLAEQHPGLITLQRFNLRNEEAPLGEGADVGGEDISLLSPYVRFAMDALRHTNGAARIRPIADVNDYMKLLAFGWLDPGVKDSSKLREIAQSEPTLPLGYWNAPEDTVESAVATVSMLNEARTRSAAPVVLVYRGQNNVKNPADWEKQIKMAQELTGGQMIIDTAQQSGMAHNPHGEFKKSLVGQVQCLHHAERLHKQGLVVAGYFIEAGDTKSHTGQHMPHEVAVHSIIRLASSKLKNN